MNPTLPGERHSSFAVNKENDSNESNHTALLMNDEDGVVVIDGNTPIGMNDRRSKMVIKIIFGFFIFISSVHGTT
jgi:hypothetical protein